MSHSVRVAIAGVGSCASSLLQAASLARRSKGPMPAVIHDEIGGYRVSDVVFVAAFDVDRHKVGLDLAKAITTEHVAAQSHVDVEPQNVLVTAGPLLDGLKGRLAHRIQPHPASLRAGVEDVTRELVAAEADVLVCLLPTGASEAVRTYARAAAAVGVAFVNATPELVANDEELAGLFAANRAALLGDDLRSHLGATTLHTALIELFRSRAIEIRDTYQVNIGGNTDFLNLSDPERAASKIASKRKALFAAGIDASTVAAGPNGYVQHLGDTKACFLRLEGTSMLGSSITLDIRMEVEDSPNAAGVLVSAVRIAKAAVDRGLTGVIDPVCPFLFKSPRYGATESEGLREFTAFVEHLAPCATPTPATTP
jgi:myo-inositol-1-phosphate synthase